MPISSNLRPSTVTTSWPPPMPIGFLTDTSIRAHKCGAATAYCSPLPTKSSTSKAEWPRWSRARERNVRLGCLDDAQTEQNRGAMTESAGEVIADDDAATLLAIESIKQ